MAFPPYVAVVGPSQPDSEVRALARAAGEALAGRGWVVVTGGLGGVMAAAAAGAASAGGTVVGLLPGLDRAAASAGHSVVIPTGLGELRNGLLVRACNAVIAVGGSWGTQSEIALAVTNGIPVHVVAGWAQQAPGTSAYDSVDDAVQALAERLSGM